MKLKSKYLWIAFGVALCAVIPLRIYQLLFLMDERGFYTDGDTISWILMAILFVSLAFFFVLSIRNKGLPKRYTHERNIPSGLSHLGLGIAGTLYSVFEIISLAMPTDAATALTGGFLYVAIILAFVGVGGGVVWIVMGIGFLSGKSVLKSAPIAGIVPPIWLAIMLFTQVVQFSGNNIALNNTEHIYDTMTIVLMTMFTFNECKMIAGAQGKKCGKRVHAYGFPMILFGVVSALPSFVALATGSVNVGSFDLVMSIMVGFLCLSAVIFLILLPRGKDAYVEELIEIEPEAPQPKAEEKVDGQVQKQNPEDLKVTRTGISRKEALRLAELEEEAEANKPAEPKKVLALRMMHSFLDFLDRLFNKKPRKKKKKYVFFKAGELDEQATMAMNDELWRLDFYGIRDDEGPFYPEFYKLEPGALEKRKEMVEDAVLEAKVYAEELDEKENGHRRRRRRRNTSSVKVPKVRIPQVKPPEVRKPGEPKPEPKPAAKPQSPKPAAKQEPAKPAVQKPQAAKQSANSRPEQKKPAAQKQTSGKQPQNQKANNKNHKPKGK